MNHEKSITFSKTILSNTTVEGSWHWRLEEWCWKFSFASQEYIWFL